MTLVKKSWQRAFDVLLGYVWFILLTGLKGLTSVPFVLPVYRALLIICLKRQVLFDKIYYLASNPDVAASGIDPLFHYVAFGDGENRKPHILFDPKYYRQEARNKLTEVNSLLHYLTIGRYKRLSPSPWFDVSYYLANNRDVRFKQVEPLTHYLSFGGYEGRSPNCEFDGAFYLAENPDVAESGLNPLIHYIQFGQIEGRLTHPQQQFDLDYEELENQDFTKFKKIEHSDIRPQPRDSQKNPNLVVIVPVYGQHTLTMQCLKSILESKNDLAYELLVIDDHSPDKALSDELLQMFYLGWINLITNDTNQGFVKSVNTGLSLNQNRDVVILNSDTEVYDYWLDRLCKAAYTNENIASVTPLSNNATICSYPLSQHNNPYPLELASPELDQLAAMTNQDLYVSTPTGVGFCMFMRRSALQKIGHFDAEAFGRGYGEENDWCQRAIYAGLINLIAPNIYVKHFGSASFKGEKRERVLQAIATVENRHPGYKKQIDRFIKEDPLLQARSNLDWARLKQQVKLTNVLIICHERGGGTERRVQELVSSLNERQIGVFFLRPVKKLKSHVRIAHSACKNVPSIMHFELADTRLLVDKLKELNLTSMHVHGLVDFTHDAPVHITNLAAAMDVPLDVDIHDYALVCPRINLIDSEGQYCGEPIAAKCNQCLARHGNNFGVKDIDQWRTVNRKMLLQANRIYAPSEDCQARINRYHPDIKIKVSPHLGETIGRRIRPATLTSHRKMHIVIIGAIGKMKGFNVLLACARDVKQRNLQIRFTLMGFSMNDVLLERQGVTVTGKYLETESHLQLSTLGPDLVWLPSLWPETYSYTLSIALSAGFPVSAFDIGAIAERLKKTRQDHYLLPLEMANNPIEINERFIEFNQKMTDLSE